MAHGRVHAVEAPSCGEAGCSSNAGPGAAAGSPPPPLAPLQARTSDGVSHLAERALAKPGERGVRAHGGRGRCKLGDCGHGHDHGGGRAEHRKGGGAWGRSCTKDRRKKTAERIRWRRAGDGGRETHSGLRTRTNSSCNSHTPVVYHPLGGGVVDWTGTGTGIDGDHPVLEVPPFITPAVQLVAPQE